MIDPFATAAVALYAGHHVGDYWVQTHHQAMHKGDAGRDGALSCLLHVLSYTATQATFLLITSLALTGTSTLWPPGRPMLALAISAVTHYLADRREHGLMFRLARALPFKRGYLEAPGGAAFLDQAWHIVFGVFVPALVLGA